MKAVLPQTLAVILVVLACCGSSAVKPSSGGTKAKDGSAQPTVRDSAIDPDRGDSRSKKILAQKAPADSRGGPSIPRQGESAEQEAASKGQELPVKAKKPDKGASLPPSAAADKKKHPHVFDLMQTDGFCPISGKITIFGEGASPVISRAYLPPTTRFTISWMLYVDDGDKLWIFPEGIGEVYPGYCGTRFESRFDATVYRESFTASKTMGDRRYILKGGKEWEE